MSYNEDTPRTAKASAASQEKALASWKAIIPVMCAVYHELLTEGPKTRTRPELAGIFAKHGATLNEAQLDLFRACLPNGHVNKNGGRTVLDEALVLPPDTMTVIIRDDSPLIFCQDAPSYRSVRIKLTPVQREALMLKSNGESCGSRVWEEISRVIIESPQDQDDHLPDLLRATRLKTALSLREIYEQCGVTPSRLSEIENGMDAPTPEEEKKIREWIGGGNAE